MAVLAAQVRPIGTAGIVGILGDSHCIIEVAGTKVDGIERFAADQLRPLQVFVMTNVVGNDLMPCKVKVLFSFMPLKAFEFVIYCFLL